MPDTLRALLVVSPDETPSYVEELLNIPLDDEVTVKEAKDHLRVPGHYDDIYIADLLKTAIETVEKRSGFRLFTQTVELRLDSFPSKKCFSLQCGKVTAVDSVKCFRPLIQSFSVRSH